MIRNYLVFGLAMLSVVASETIAMAQIAPPAAQWLPEGAVIVVQIEQPGALLDLTLDLKIPESIAATASYRQMATAPDFKGFLGLVDALERKGGTDWKGVVRRLSSRGITYASYPGDRTVLLLDAADSVAPEQFQQIVQGLIAGGKGSPKGVFYKEFPGLSTWSLDGKQFWARFGNRLIVTNRVETMKALFAPRTSGSMAAAALYSKAQQAAGTGAVATGYVNMAVLNQAQAAQKKPADVASPFSILLNGAVTESLSASTWIALSLRVENRKLLLHVASDGKLNSAGAGGFTLPKSAGQGVLPDLTVPRQLATASLWRDLHKFYSARETLFPEKTSAAILFENFMEIFFTGKNLNDEVFARFHPEVRMVVARQDYNPAIGTPLVQYPAAALIFKVEQAEEFGEVLEEAWQKAIGISNFTRGQQALPGLIFDKASHGGVPFTFGYYSVRNEKDRKHLPSHFNLRPALVRVGPYIILSTTDSLAGDVIDAVNKEDGRTPANRSTAHSVLEISNGADIAALLGMNRNELVRQDVVGKGMKPEAAETQLELNMTLLKHFDRFRFSMSEKADGQQADFELQFK